MNYPTSKKSNYNYIYGNRGMQLEDDLNNTNKYYCGKDKENDALFFI